jgi:hypothetical protein
MGTISSAHDDVELVALDGGAFDAKRLRPIATVGTGRLDLERAAQRFRIVLQRDRAAHRAALGIEEHEAALEQSWGAGEGRHAVRAP